MGAGLTDFTGKDLPDGATVGAPPTKKSDLIDFTGKDIPTGAKVGIAPGVDASGKPERVDLTPSLAPSRKEDFFGNDPNRPQPTARMAPLDSLPTKDQLSINYFAKQGDPTKLRKYLTSNGYNIAGWDGEGNITFRDKRGNLYAANSFAAIPAAVGALPAIGQVAGTLGGGAITGGLGGEAVGAGVGEAGGEYAQNKILQAAGLPAQNDPKTIAENAAIAAATQGVAGKVLPGVAKSLSGYTTGTEAAAAREAEIAAAGESAATKQGERILTQGKAVERQEGALAAKQKAISEAETAKVTKESEAAAQKQQELINKTAKDAEKTAIARRAKLTAQAAKAQSDLDKFHQTVRQQAMEAIGKEQEAKELAQATGRTPEQAQVRKSQLISEGAGTMKAAREPYYAAYDMIKTQQGQLFDKVFEDVPKNTAVPTQMQPAIDGVKQFVEDNKLKLSSEANGLLNKTSNLSEDVDPDELRGQTMKLLAGRHPDSATQSRFNALLKDYDKAPGEKTQEGLNAVARQALGFSAEPSNLGDLLGLRSRWLAIGRGRSASAADRWAANRMVDALDSQIENVPGLSEEKLAQLGDARNQYHEFKNLFDNKLQDAVFKASDPTEIAKAVFEGHEKVPLNLINAIKDDPERMETLRSAYQDHVMSAGGPDKTRKILARDDKNGVLKAMMGDGAYSQYQTWLRTPDYQAYAERALSTDAGRKAFQQSVYNAYGTPESRQMVDKFKQAQELLARAPDPQQVAQEAASKLPTAAAVGQQTQAAGMAQIPGTVAQKTVGDVAELAQQQTLRANMPSPDQVRVVEQTQQRVGQSPDRAAGQAIYDSAHKGTGIFTGGGLVGYMKRRAAFGLITGMMMHNPAIWLASGGVLAYERLWTMAMTSPEAADAYWNFLSKMAGSKGVKAAGRAFTALTSALLDNVIRGEVDARRRRQQAEQTSAATGLRAAVKTGDGRVVAGAPGETHNDIVARSESGERGFVTKDGRFLSRPAASARVGARELHSTGDAG